jgi:site-specific recombinase XerD
MNISEAITEFMRRYFAESPRAEKTVGAYLTDLTGFGGYVGEERQLDVVNGELIGAWVEHLRGRKYSAASVRRKTATVRVFCSFWVRAGELSDTPFLESAPRAEIARAAVRGCFTTAVKKGRRERR